MSIILVHITLSILPGNTGFFLWQRFRIRIPVRYQMSQHLYRHRDRIVWLDGWMVLLECLVVVRGWMVEWFCKSAWLHCVAGWVDGFV